MSRRPLLAASLLALVSCSGDAGEAATGAVGAAPASAEAAPVVEVVRFEDLDAFLEQHRGQGVLLNFWATWCAPCVAELPELLEVAEQYEARGGRVVGVSYDLMVPTPDPEQVPGMVSAFLARKGWDFPVAVFDDDDYERINAKFGLGGSVPETLAIDRTGAIVDREQGRADGARFDELMRAALGI